MKTLTTLSAAALLSMGLAGGAFAQSEEPDCPEDFDTEPGCDMSLMDEEPGEAEVRDSERQPVEGAATAPVEAESGESKTLASPEDDAPEPSEENSSEPTDGAVDTDAESDSGDMSDDAATDDSASMSEGDDTAASTGASTGGTDHEVMARGVRFAPAIIFIEPGDTVNWSNMASHNVETIGDMMPEGAAEINSEIGENVSQTFETEGIIVYKCTPHWGNRMGGIIVVGDPEDPMGTIDAYMQAAEENTENLPALGLLKDLREEMEG